MEDEVARALKLLIEDDRRRPDDEEAVAGHWRREFRDLPQGELMRALSQWLRENPRGRPNVGKLWAVIKKLQTAALPTTTKQELWIEEKKRHELLWATSILEIAHVFEKYPDTLMYARKCCLSWGYTSWEDAKAYVEPGWCPPEVNEAYL